MKFFQKRGVAIAVLVLAIVASSAWGLHKAPAITENVSGVELDTSLDTSYYRSFVCDEADILSDRAEEAASLYNANWDSLFGGIMAVVTVEKSDDIEDDAWKWAENTLSLGENDALLLLSEEQREYYVVASGTFYDNLSALPTGFVGANLEAPVIGGDFDEAVQQFYAALHEEMSSSYYQIDMSWGDSSAAATITGFIMVLLAVLVIWVIIDRIRYNRYRKRYLVPGMGTPTVVYRPVFWGRPRRPRPHHSPRPPHGGGTRPPHNGGFGGGFGGSPRPPRQTPKRPSGGNHSGSFGSRSGGFGGSSRGGSFGGGSRSGGFGGGSRGGGFGGSRR